MKEIKVYLLEKGIRPENKGFYYLEFMIKKIKENKCSAEMCKLYFETAKEFETTYSKVERAARHSVNLVNEKSVGNFIHVAKIEIWGL